MRSPRFLHLPFLGVAAVCHQLLFGVGKTSTYANILAYKPLDLPECPMGPDALTDLLGTSIPQTCIPYPVGEDEITGTTLVEERCFYTYVPESAVQLQNAQEDSRGVPLVVDVHGYMGCPYFQVHFSGWFELAEKEGFVVMWPASARVDPSGTSCWAVPGGIKNENIDRTTPSCCCIDTASVGFIKTDKLKEDPIFIKQAIDSVVEQQQQSVSSNSPISIDKSRIYMAGHSNGCIASLSMAAMYSETIAAVCCHAGSLVTLPDPDYTPVPIWMINGKNEEIIPAEGSIAIDIPLLGSIGLWPRTEIFDYLASQNECSEEKTVRDLLDEDTQQVVGTITQKTGCSQGATVEFVDLDNMGHWPYKLPPIGAGRDDQLLDIVGAEKFTTIDTTAMAWEFCSSYSKVSNTDEDEEESLDESPNTEEGESTSSSSSSSSSFSSGQGRMILLLLLLSVPLVMQLM